MELKSEKIIREETNVTEEQRKWAEKMKTEDLFKEFPKFLKRLKESQIDILCFMNQDAYLLYELFKQQEQKIYNYKIMFASCLENNNPDEFFGKRIILFDCFLSSGYKLFEWYCRLEKFGAKVFPIVYAQSMEFPTSRSRMCKVYYDIFNLEITETTEEEAKRFFRDWLGDIWSEKYIAQREIVEVELQILKLFHQDYYLQFKSGKWASVFESVQSMVMYSEQYKIPIEEVKAKIEGLREEEFLECLQILQEVGIIETNKEFSIVQRGKNTDWIFCREGRLCYFCVEPLFWCISPNKIFCYMEKFLLEAKNYCDGICKEYKEAFDKNLFQHHIDGYIKMDKDELEYYVQGDCLQEMTPLEKEIHEEMKKRASQL